jgi:Bacterial Ig-like domain (group 2)
MSDRGPLRDYRNSRAVVMGTWDYAHLPTIPAAFNSLDRFVRMLTGPECGWPPDRMIRLENPVSAGDLPLTLTRAFADVTDVALFYFVGHGQAYEGEPGSTELCLGVEHSRQEASLRSVTSLPFPAVRYALHNSPARIKIIILDCCYAALAHRRIGLGPQPAAVPDAEQVLDAAGEYGAYILAAADSSAEAWFELGPDKGPPQTYFTKYLADLVESGLPGEPTRLPLETLFRALRGRMVAAGLPRPEARNVDGGGACLFAHNNSSAPQVVVDPEAHVQGLEQPPTVMHVPHHGLAAASGLMTPVPAARRRRRERLRAVRSRWPTAALMSGGLAGLAVAAWLFFPGHRVPAGESTTARTVSYQFPRRQPGDGLVVTRRWTLGGPHGSRLSERLIAASATGRALAARFTEPVPAALAGHLSSARFSPAVPKIIDDRHVLQWQLRIPARHAEIVSYSVAVAPDGVSRARLARLARGFSLLLARSQAPPWSLTIKPTSVTLTPGESEPLTLSARPASGQALPRRDLVSASWTTQHHAVAVVRRSERGTATVTAVGPGTTRLTATVRTAAGKVTVSIVVTVSPAPAPYTSEYTPGGSGYTSPTPTPTPTPTLTIPTPTPSQPTTTPPPGM